MSTDTIPVLQMVGLDGNAFSVMGAWKRAARKAGWNADEIQAVLDDAMSGDYNHLLAVIMDNSESPPYEYDDDDDWDD